MLHADFSCQPAIPIVIPDTLLRKCYHLVSDFFFRPGPLPGPPHMALGPHHGPMGPLPGPQGPMLHGPAPHHPLTLPVGGVPMGLGPMGVGPMGPGPQGPIENEPPNPEATLAALAEAVPSIGLSSRMKNHDDNEAATETKSDEENGNDDGPDLEELALLGIDPADFAGFGK